MKTVLEHFNIDKRDHVVAVQHFNTYGAFPSGFLIKGVEFNIKDIPLINKQIEEAGYTTLEDPTNKPKESESYDAPDGTDESVDLATDHDIEEET